MRRVLQAKHWQLFLLFSSPSIFQGMGGSIFLDIFLHSLFVIFYVGWLLLLGTWLSKVSQTPRLSYPLFIIVGLILIGVLITYRILVVFDVLSLKVFDVIPTDLLMLCYIVVSLVILGSFIGKNLKTIEMGEDVDINDYINDILSLIFWPIGIWMFQPRIRNLDRRLSGYISEERNIDADPLSAFEHKGDVKQRFKQRTVNRVIGYGILIFVIGFLVGVNWVKYVQLLIPIGSIMTFFGVFYFLKQTNLQDEFRMDRKDDVLTYFWDVIVLKLWTLLFVVWMIVSNLTLLTSGWL